jgi:hypothetical protein
MNRTECCRFVFTRTACEQMVGLAGGGRATESRLQKNQGGDA